MGFKDQYNAVLNKIKEVVKTITDVKLILVGEREKIEDTEFPCVFIIPRTDDIEYITGESRQHMCTFDLTTLIKNTDVQAGLVSCLDIALKIYDKIMEDKTLGYTCDTVFPRTIAPDYVVGPSEAYQWVTVRITTRIIELP